MKLFDKYNRLNITATILTFVLGSCTFYFLLYFILINQLDETLQTEQQEITAFVATHNTLPEIIKTKDQFISYEPARVNAKATFHNITNTSGKGEEKLREIEFTIEAGNKYYLFKVAKPLEETESLLKVIICVTIAMIGLILLIGYWINRTMIRKLWQPFYQSIDQIKNYSITDLNTLKLDYVAIDEFALLNKSINELTERIQKDYTSLKDFTGQAAHEMQTPLAIIRSKLEMIMQNELVVAQNEKHIGDIEKAVHRLSRLHQSLLLLTKIENRQFIATEKIRLDQLIKEKIDEYQELIDAMQIATVLNLQPINIVMHPHMAEIVCSNLINNAIRYNHKGGTIEISIEPGNLTITNTSPYPELDEDKIFKRFYRDGNKDDGNGLGLSIVKQISDVAGHITKYHYRDGKHCFVIGF